MNNKLPSRKNTRLKNYDYSQVGCYFITICVQGRRKLLGNIINDQLSLSEYGLITKHEIENISTIRKECIIDKYVIMPNHLHITIQIERVGGTHFASKSVSNYGKRLKRCNYTADWLFPLATLFS